MDARIAQDEQPGRGPLQGLLAGLDSIGSEVDAVYLTSCDVPLLRPAFVAQIISLLEDFDIAVPVTEGRPHPLAAVYRVDVRAAVRELLAADRLRPVFLFERFRTRLVRADDLRTSDRDLVSLRNVNTPEDYAALLREVPSSGDCPEHGLP